MASQRGAKRNDGVTEGVLNTNSFVWPVATGTIVGLKAEPLIALAAEAATPLRLFDKHLSHERYRSSQDEIEIQYQGEQVVAHDGFFTEQPDKQQYHDGVQGKKKGP